MSKSLNFDPPSYTIAPATQVVGGEVDEATIDLLFANSEPYWHWVAEGTTTELSTPLDVFSDAPVSSWERDQ